MTNNFLVLKKLKAKYISATVVLIFACIMYCGCGDSGSGPKVDNIKIVLQTKRLDQALYNLDTNHLSAGLQELKQQYPQFLDFYLDTLMGFGIEGQYVDTLPAVQLGLRTFLTHKDYRGVFDTVAVHYPDTKEIDEDLTKGFRYLKHYYPGAHVPEIIYLVSGLNNWAAFTYDSVAIGIGLDMYLGARYPFYKAVQLPDYAIRKCSPEYIVPNVFQAIYRGQRPFVQEEKTLLDMMIQRGKEQYYLSKVLPFTADTVRLGFTEAQLEWCVASEAQVYNFFVRDNLLYETNWQKILRYVNDGPNATGMPA